MSTAGHQDPAGGRRRDRAGWSPPSCAWSCASRWCSRSCSRSRWSPCWSSPARSPRTTPDFGGLDPAKWYVSSYLAVVIAAVGLVMVPVHVAAYRERGVLRRFAAAGFPRWSFALASGAVGVTLSLTGCLVLLAFAAPVYGLPPLHRPAWVVAGVLVGAVAITSIGLLIGCLVPSARAAQGVGLLAFFPSFLLGGGGPPPSVLGPGVRSVANLLPLTHVTESIRDPWLGSAPVPPTSRSWPASCWPRRSVGGARSDCDPGIADRRQAFGRRWPEPRTGVGRCGGSCPVRYSPLPPDLDAWRTRRPCPTG